MASTMLRITKGTGTMPAVIDGQLVFNTATQKLYLDSGTTRYLMGGAKTSTPSSLTISLNGTSQGAWDGSSAKSINIAWSNIGAMSANPESIELNSKGTLSGYGGFIDFHYNGSTADYTSRIIESVSGVLTINNITFNASTKTIAATTFSGNATSATKATQDGNGATISSTYLKLSGGTMTGSVTFAGETRTYYKIERNVSGGGGWAYSPFNVRDNNNSTFAQIGVYGGGNTLTYMYMGSGDYDSTANLRIYRTGTVWATSVEGAVWNDYAEYRSGAITEPGKVVKECPDGILRITESRLEPGCEIISDTFGFVIGETDECKTPVATSGRVLAYPFEDRDTFELGQAVCSGPNGTVSRMTREEIMMYPERIIGTVSEIPQYEIWGTGNVQINGRIWIRIR